MNQRILQIAAIGVAAIALLGANVRTSYGLFNDATGAQVVDSIAGTSTVSGTVTANAGTGTFTTAIGGTATAAVAANTVANTVVKASAGRVAAILVTATAAAEIDCYDNASAASGTKIAVVAASAAVGTVATFNMPAANGITCAGAATMPGYTISYY